MKRYALVLVLVVLVALVGCKEHEHSWKLVSEKGPSCAAAGEKVYKCISCGAQKIDTVGSALGHVSDNDYDYLYDNGKLYTQTHCTVCRQSLEPVLMDEDSYVIVTPANSKTLSYTTSNTVYYFTEGEYGDMTGNYALWYRKGENITFVGDKKASFNNLGVGYHGNHDKDNPAKENSTLEVKGFNVVGTLTVSTIDRNVVIEDNVCGSIAIYPCKTSDMVVSVKDNSFDGSKNGSYKYNLYVVPEVTGYTLNVTGNDFANASSHCIAIQGNGQGSATTAAKKFDVSDNVFKSFGTDGKDGRAAFKIWEDTNWAPTDGAPMSADANALMDGIIAHNTFECNIDGTKLVYGNFYGVAYMPKN